jgi:hypothetical protein
MATVLNFEVIFYKYYVDPISYLINKFFPKREQNKHKTNQKKIGIAWVSTSDVHRLQKSLSFGEERNIVQYSRRVWSIHEVNLADSFIHSFIYYQFKRSIQLDIEHVTLR